MKWINFIDEMPKVGQKVALFTYFNENKSANICTGVVLDKSKKRNMFARLYPDDTICVEAGVSHSLDGYFSVTDTYLYELAIGFRKEITEKITKATWMKRKTARPFFEGRLFVPRHGRKKTEYIGRSATYWTPIEEDIPESLPEFPEPKTITFIYEHGEKMILKSD